MNDILYTYGLYDAAGALIERGAHRVVDLTPVEYAYLLLGHSTNPHTVYVWHGAETVPAARIESNPVPDGRANIDEATRGSRRITWPLGGAA